MCSDTWHLQCDTQTWGCFQIVRGVNTGIIDIDLKYITYYEGHWFVYYHYIYSKKAYLTVCKVHISTFTDEYFNCFTVTFLTSKSERCGTIL